MMARLAGPAGRLRSSFSSSTTGATFEGQDGLAGIGAVVVLHGSLFADGCDVDNPVFRSGSAPQVARAGLGAPQGVEDVSRCQPGCHHLPSRFSKTSVSRPARVVTLPADSRSIE